MIILVTVILSHQYLTSEVNNPLLKFLTAIRRQLGMSQAALSVCSLAQAGKGNSHYFSKERPRQSIARWSAPEPFLDQKEEQFLSVTIGSKSFCKCITRM